LPRQTSQILSVAGYQSVDVRDIGMSTATDNAIADYAKAHTLCILTRDHDFGDVQSYPPDQYAGIVVFEMPDHLKLQFLLTIIERFAKDALLITRLPGHLAIVDAWRVRLR
jgi:hypothetical protein